MLNVDHLLVLLGFNHFRLFDLDHRENLNELAGGLLGCCLLCSQDSRGRRLLGFLLLPQHLLLLLLLLLKQHPFFLLLLLLLLLHLQLLFLDLADLIQHYLKSLSEE